jgi:hypothetical protein
VLDGRPCDVNTAEELNREIRGILSIEMVYPDRAGEISGTLYVDYADESVKNASLIPELEARDVTIVWRKKK